MASSKDSVNVEILFVEGVLDDHVKLITVMTACCITLPVKTDDSCVQRLRRAWQPNVNFAVSRQTVNRRLVARAYKARRMVKVPRLTVRAKLVRRHWAHKHIHRSLGQWQNVIFCDESRFMLFRIDNRIRVRRLVGEVMHEDCTLGNVAHGGGSVHVWGGISYMEKTLLVRFGSDVTGSRLSPSYGGTLGSTWQDMVSQQLATG